MPLSSDLRHLRHLRPAYARCPACRFVTAPAWELRARGRLSGWPAVVGCGYCGHEHAVEQDLAYPFDALIRHGHCGTTVACPREADLVRCSGAGPDGLPCGDLFAGPAAPSPAVSGPRRG